MPRKGCALLKGHSAFCLEQMAPHEVDDLVLVDRRPQVVDGAGIVAIELDDLPLLPGKPTCLLAQGAIELVLGDLDVVAPADLGKEEPDVES